MKKKIVAMCATVAIAALAVGGTLAYFTDTDNEVKNTFSVGNIEITLDEANVDEYGVKDGDTRVAENGYKLIPGHEYVKDPTIHVAKGSEPCWLFVKVTDEIAAIQDNATVAAQMAANGWEAFAGAENVWVYGKTVDAREAAQDVNVFGVFKIKVDADVAEYADKTIVVNAYAIQADGLTTADAAWDALGIQ